MLRLGTRWRELLTPSWDALRLLWCSAHPHLFQVKNPPVSAGDAREAGSIPGLGRSPRGGKGKPLQYSCLGNSMDRGAWWATAVANSQTRLSTHTQNNTHGPAMNSGIELPGFRSQLTHLWSWANRVPSLSLSIPIRTASSIHISVTLLFVLVLPHGHKIIRSIAVSLGSASEGKRNKSKNKQMGPN